MPSLLASGMAMGTTKIAAGTRVAGPLYATGDVEVAGVIDGNLDGEATVTLLPGAQIGGLVRGRTVVIGCTLRGPVQATSSIRLLASADLRGDLDAPRVIIDDGALFEGQVRMPRGAARTLPDVAPATLPAIAPPATLAPQTLPQLVPPEHRRTEIPELPSLGRRRLQRRMS